MNDDHHAPYDPGSNCITRCTDFVCMVEMFKIAYGRSWKSRRISCMRRGEEVRLNISKLVNGFICGELPAESAGMWWANFIHHPENVSSGQSEIERVGGIWMQMFIHRNDLFAANDDYMRSYIPLLSTHWLSVCHKVECQRSIKDF